MDIEARDDEGNTALHLSSECDSNMALMLLDVGAKVDYRNSDRRTPLHRAVMAGRLDCIDMLLQHGADIEAENNYKK